MTEHQNRFEAKLIFCVRVKYRRKSKVNISYFLEFYHSLLKCVVFNFLCSEKWNQSDFKPVVKSLKYL